MKIQDHIKPGDSGWYQSENSRQFHYFDSEGVPICEKSIRGFPLYVARFGTKIKEDHPNYFNGFCKKCITKKEKQS